MIATTTGFWKAFFDGKNKTHTKARRDILIFDKEKIVVSQLTVSEVLSWLIKCKKTKHANWFLNYVNQTANVRVFHFGKEEYGKISELIAAKTDLTGAGDIYLHKQLNCDLTTGYEKEL